MIEKVSNFQRCQYMIISFCGYLAMGNMIGCFVVGVAEEVVDFELTLVVVDDMMQHSNRMAVFVDVAMLEFYMKRSSQCC